MQKGSLLIGYRYLYSTSDPDTVVVSLRDVLFRKHEWVVTRGNVPAMCGTILVDLPVYLADNGTYSEIQGELVRWQMPGFADIFGPR